MSREIVMPQLGSEMEEGYLVEWLKKEGERIEKDEPLFRVETDKAVLDAESDYDGVLEEILIEEGENVRVGTVIARLADNGQSG